MLLGMLTLSKRHREHLRTVRGLTDQQIDALGYKSTPPFYLCRKLADRLLEKGCTLQGVPGFYQKDGHWTVKFYTKTVGILIPARGIDSLIRGLQIRLDVPNLIKTIYFDDELIDNILNNGIVQFYCFSDYVYLRNYSDYGAIGKIEDSQVKSLLLSKQLRIA